MFLPEDKDVFAFGDKSDSASSLFWRKAGITPVFIFIFAALALYFLRNVLKVVSQR
jgi:hypothetical protein